MIAGYKQNGDLILRFYFAEHFTKYSAFYYKRDKIRFCPFCP